VSERLEYPRVPERLEYPRVYREGYTQVVYKGDIPRWCIRRIPSLVYMLPPSLLVYAPSSSSWVYCTLLLPGAVRPW